MCGPVRSWTIIESAPAHRSQSYRHLRRSNIYLLRHDYVSATMGKAGRQRRRLAKRQRAFTLAFFGHSHIRRLKELLEDQPALDPLKD